MDLGNKEITYKDYLERQEEVNLSRPINAYHNELKIIVRKYKLPPKWKRAIEAYAFSDKPKYEGSVGISMSVPIGDDGEDKIKVIVDAYTTKRDLMDAWSRISYHQDRLKSKERAKFQPINKAIFERNKLAYDLKEKGEGYAKIAKIINEKYDGVYTYNDVQTMVRNYKRLLGIN